MNKIEKLKKEIHRLNLGLDAIGEIIANGGVAPPADNQPPFIRMDEKGWGLHVRDSDGELYGDRFDLTKLMQESLTDGWDMQSMKLSIAHTEKLLAVMKKDLKKYS